MVSMAAASLPEFGSVRAKDAVFWPLAMPGRNLLLCSSLPNMRMPWDPMPLLVPIRVRKQALALAISSYSRQVPTMSRPRPPYSWGMVMPKRPILRILSTTSSGIWSASSTFSSMGSNSSFTNRATVSRSNFRSSGIDKSIALASPRSWNPRILLPGIPPESYPKRPAPVTRNSQRRRRRRGRSAARRFDRSAVSSAPPVPEPWTAELPNKRTTDRYSGSGEPEIGGPELSVLADRGRRAAEDHPPMVHDVHLVRQAQGHLDILFDEQAG